MIPIAEAISIIKREIGLLDFEACKLEFSCGRILAEDIFADTDLPPFDRSQMDGFALKANDLESNPAKLLIIGESIAGKRFQGELRSGEAVRIMTGAALPIGADSVQKVELTKAAGDFVEITERTKIGQFIVDRGSEIKNGEKVFSKGDLISANMIASLAAFGYAKVLVSKRPKISILATGSEIIAIDAIPKQDEIRNSNSIMLSIFASKYAEVETLPIAKDDLESLKTQIKGLNSDIVILTGGVSMGDYDFTKPALRELGAQIFFDKVALKPGKPCVFAKLGNTLIFGLPGNPVSVAVTFNLFVRQALLEMQSSTQSCLKSGFAILSKPTKGAIERDSYLPAILSTNENGQLLVENSRWTGSSNFIAFSRTDCLIFIPKGCFLEAGSVVSILFL